MPSVSRQQQKLMHGIASGNIKPRKGIPSKKVAQDFVAADHARGPMKLPSTAGGNGAAHRIANAIATGKSKEQI